jgi:hypothetical protein
MQRLSKVSEIIDACGGPRKFAASLGVTYSRVSMWKSREMFPPNTICDLRRILKEEFGIEAPPSLWGQVKFNRRGK